MPSEKKNVGDIGGMLGAEEIFQNEKLCALDPFSHRAEHELNGRENGRLLFLSVKYSFLGAGDRVTWVDNQE
jgi:hypothetical protein